MKTEAAKAAKMIRQELKAKFPLIKFKVTSCNYSLGDSVSISWDNGISCDEVDVLVKKYQMGVYDSMEDIYNYTNRRDDIPQVTYVMTERFFV